MSNHVDYLVEGSFEQAKERGWNGAGWYFWDEVGHYCYGPYATIGMAEYALECYSKKIYDNFK